MNILLRLDQVSKAFDGVHLKAGDRTFTAGRLGRLEIAGDNVLLGVPFTFNRDNIDKFDF